MLPSKVEFQKLNPPLAFGILEIRKAKSAFFKWYGIQNSCIKQTEHLGCLGDKMSHHVINPQQT